LQLAAVEAEVPQVVAELEDCYTHLHTQLLMHKQSQQSVMAGQAVVTVNKELLEEIHLLLE
jgi:hypothetical protein